MTVKSSDNHKIIRRGNDLGAKSTTESRNVRGSDRRTFLRAMATQGVSIPAAYFMLGAGSRGVPEARAGVAKEGSRHKGAMRLPVGDAKAHTDDGLIVRDFSDPYIELIRLLREASWSSPTELVHRYS